ncbi:unnamed protein product [Victoria cruziana]
MSRIVRQRDASSPGPRAHSASSLLLSEWRRRRSRAAVAAGDPSVMTDSVDDELRRASEMQKDDAAARRRVREAFKNVQLSIDHCLLKTAYPGIRMEEMYETNSRGAEIFSKYWIPQFSPLKAMIFFCHGYGDTCTFFFEGTARKLASCGYGVFAIDYPGFGLSDGLHGYIPNFDILVDDVMEQFSKAIYNVISYKDQPRLRTAVELLRATRGIEDHLEEVSLPLLILHGQADVVTDPSVSKALYEKAISRDKKLILYEGAYHAILEGESDESIFHVLEDVVSWLDRHRLK